MAVSTIRQDIERLRDRQKAGMKELAELYSSPLTRKQKWKEHRIRKQARIDAGEEEEDEDTPDPYAALLMDDLDYACVSIQSGREELKAIAEERKKGKEDKN
jgi:hypothetical protein